MKTLARLFHNIKESYSRELSVLQTGATMIEYVLIASLISGVAITGVTSAGVSTANASTNIHEALAGNVVVTPDIPSTPGVNENGNTGEIISPEDTPIPVPNDVDVLYSIKDIIYNTPSVVTFLNRPIMCKIDSESPGGEGYVGATQTIKNALAAAGAPEGSWRVYTANDVDITSNSILANKFNIFYTPTNISKMNIGDTVEAVKLDVGAGEITYGTMTVTENNKEAYTYNILQNFVAHSAE